MSRPLIKTTSRGFLAFCIHEFRKKGRWRFPYGAITWSRGDKPYARIEYVIHDDHILFLWLAKNQLVTQSIALVSSPVGFGWRYFFQCPSCNKAVSLLYSRQLFYCRKCQNLTYISCQENHSSWHKKLNLKSAKYRNFFKVIDYSRELEQRKRKGKKMLRRLGKYVKKSGVKF